MLKSDRILLKEQTLLDYLSLIKPKPRNISPNLT